MEADANWCEGEGEGERDREKESESERTYDREECLDEECERE